MNMNDSKLVTFSCQICGRTFPIRESKIIKKYGQEERTCRATQCIRIATLKMKEMVKK